MTDDVIRFLWRRLHINDTKSSTSIYRSALVKTAARKLSVDPYRFEELKGPLKGLRSYHFTYNNTEYRIAYRIVEDKSRIEIVLVKTRERFYQILKRILREEKKLK